MIKRTSILVAALLLVNSTACGAAVEEGHARFTPWSGYWWPMREGKILAPLSKYDRLTGRQAVSWERGHHPPRRDTPNWHGYCHAWAASSVMEKEPNSTVVASGMQAGGGSLPLHVGDQKALLALCHTRDAANVYGDRFDDGDGEEEKHDLSPEGLWRLLKLYVKDRGLPLILDIEAGPEVWNYPIYAYRIAYSPQGNSGTQAANLTLWMADNSVAPDFVGVQVRRHTYRFSFRLSNGAVLMGSGRWQAASREDHPDFAWYPFLPVAENPEIDYESVHQLIGDSRVSQPVESPPTGSEPGPDSEPLPPATHPGDGPPAAEDPLPAEGAVALPRDERGGRPITLSPHELVALIADKTSSFGLDVTIDRFDGARYKLGEPITIRGTSGSAGYLYLVLVDSTGGVQLLYPLADQDNRINAQQPFRLPGAEEKHPFRASGPIGIQRIKAVVTGRPLLLTGLIRPQRSAGRQQSVTGEFRWHPTQRRQIQRLLTKFGRGEKIDASALTGVAPPKLLGRFAQDEVAFFVERGENVDD